MATALDAQASRLLREVKEHKSAYSWHKKKAREKRQQLDELIAAAAARGIPITVNGTQPKGGHGGNHSTSTTNQAQD